MAFGKEDVLSVSGEYGVINQIAFQGRSFAGESVADYHVVETDDIVYTKSPLKANPYGIIKVNKGIPGIVSTLYAVYHPLNTIAPRFVDLYFANDLRLLSMVTLFIIRENLTQLLTVLSTDMSEKKEASFLHYILVWCCKQI